MKTRTWARILRRLKDVVGADGGPSSDGRLLERFVDGQDQAAFAELVQRHGSMVMGLCRRLLADSHEAEDVFQATFFILVKRSAYLDRERSLANWLYTVAYRLALRARSARFKRQAREKSMAIHQGDSSVADESWSDLRPILDEEVNRLPERYRQPIVLCYLQGKTNDEAARELGWSRGTVAGRLSRARDLLRGRISKRGIALGAAGLAAILPAHASGAVPAVLVQSTIQGASGLAAGKSLAAAGISTNVIQLIEGALQHMFITRIKWAAIFLFVLVGVGGGSSLLLHRDNATPENTAHAAPVLREENGERAKIAALVRRSNLIFVGTLDDQSKKLGYDAWIGTPEIFLGRAPLFRPGVDTKGPFGMQPVRNDKNPFVPGETFGQTAAEGKRSLWLIHYQPPWGLARIDASEANIKLVREEIAAAMKDIIQTRGELEADCVVKNVKELPIGGLGSLHSYTLQLSKVTGGKAPAGMTSVPLMHRTINGGLPAWLAEDSKVTMTLRYQANDFDVDGKPVFAWALREKGKPNPPDWDTLSDPKNLKAMGIE